LGVIGNVIGQKFQSDRPVQGQVLGLVDDTHAAATEFLDDVVVRNGLAYHAQECYGGSVGKSMKAVDLA
jgi:hypothetical protein